MSNQAQSANVNNNNNNNAPQVEKKEEKKELVMVSINPSEFDLEAHINNYSGNFAFKHIFYFKNVRKDFI